MRTNVLQKRRERKPYGREPWPVEALSAAVARNYSIAGVLSELGCTVSGSNYRWVHRLVEKYSLDTAHWLGEAHLRGKHHSWTPSIPLEEILVERSTYTDRNRLKCRLVREGLLRYACGGCGIAEWQGRPLVLELDHRNGVGDDHRIENLRLLCPNCHSQTDTYCGRNTARAKASREQCRERDSNPHGFPHAFLRGARLPGSAIPAGAINSNELVAGGAPAAQALEQASAEGRGGGGAALQAHRGDQQDPSQDGDEGGHANRRGQLRAAIERRIGPRRLVGRQVGDRANLAILNDRFDPEGEPAGGGTGVQALRRSGLRFSPWPGGALGPGHPSAVDLAVRNGVEARSGREPLEELTDVHFARKGSVALGERRVVGKIRPRQIEIALIARSLIRGDYRRRVAGRLRSGQRHQDAAGHQACDTNSHREPQPGHD